MNDSVLYYPRIHMNNLEWLKSTLLLWDHVYRIVPEGYRPNDGKEVRLAAEQGLVRDIHVDKMDLIETAGQFRRFVERSFLPDGLSTEYEPVHPEKIDATLYPELKRLCKDVGDGWLHLPEPVARGYMFYLSRVVAERRQLSRVTDQSASWSMSTFFSEDGNFDEFVFNADAEGHYASLVFQDVLPGEVSGVPMKDIADFVDNRRDERAHVRDVLQNFAIRLTECSSKEHCDVLLADMRMKLERAKDDFRKSMGWIGKTTHATLVVGLPVATAVFGAMSAIQNPYCWTSLLPSVLIGAVAAYVDFGRARSLQRPNTVGAYLVDMENQLYGFRGLESNRFADQFEEFIND